MSIRINQELNNIRNATSNLNIAISENTQEILTETNRAVGIENNILGALLIEKNRAQYAEAGNTQAIFSEATRAAAAEGTNEQAILDETTRSLSISNMLYDKSNINKALAETERVRSVAADEDHAAEISALRDENNQYLLDKIVYAFQVTSNLNANQLIQSGVTAKFNSIEYNTPANTYLEIASQYIVPKDGLYLYGFKLFINSTDEKNFRMGIYQNNNLKMMGGASAETSETLSGILKCNMGDTVHVGCITGSAHIYMSVAHSFFYGYRIGNFV